MVSPINGGSIDISDDAVTFVLNSVGIRLVTKELLSLFISPVSILVGSKSEWLVLLILLLDSIVNLSELVSSELVFSVSSVRSTVLGDVLSVFLFKRVVLHEEG